MSDDSPLWVWRGTIVNAAGASGDHEYIFSSEIGSEFRLLYGLIKNGDTSNRSTRGEIDVGTDDLNLTRVFRTRTTTAGGAEYSFPDANSNVEEGAANPQGSDWAIAGGTRLRIRVLAVAVSQDSELEVTCRLLHGGPPTVTLVSPANATETTVTSQVR